MQTYTDGNVGNIINAYDDGNIAEQQYHTILAAAAVSELPAHAAVIMTNEGQVITRQCYHHEIPADEEIPDEEIPDEEPPVDETPEEETPTEEIDENGVIVYGTDQ